MTRPTDGDSRRPGAPLDSRYRPSPTVERPAPTLDRPRQPASVPAGERDAARPATRRPVDAPAASTRYRPADTIRTGTRIDAPTPRPAKNNPAPVLGNMPSATTTPVLAAVEPRLSQPRASSITSGVLAQRSGWSHGSHWHHRHYSSCHPSWWYGYWDPWYCHSSYSYGWYDCNAWTIGTSCSSFGWSLSLWYPYWYCRSSYWDRCYHDSFWCSWSRPHCVSTSYWWYPSTTYCPTYLYVPSTVYVTESEPAPAPASTEVVVAGGGVVGSARVIEDRASGDSLAMSLAMKYVELGDFYFKADRFRDAAEAYGKARSYAPDDASVHFVLADAVFADGDYHYAAFLIAEGVRLDPAMAGADTDKRTFYRAAKTFDAQMAALDAYLAKAPYDAQAQFVRAYNLRFSGRASEALTAFRRVLEIAPDHRGAQTFVAALEARPAAK